MTVMVPEKSLAQRLEALERANVVRTRRARLKRDLTAGRRNVAVLLTEWPEEIDTMKVSDLLMAVRGVGRSRTTAMLRRAAVSPSKTVGGLTGRQRESLIAVLPARIRER